MNSSTLQQYILKFLSDNEKHTVQEIKNYLSDINNDYTDGQFSGSINTLQRNGSIKKIERGVYVAKTRKENMRKCFVVSPIGEEGSETRKRADQLFKYVINPVCEQCEFNAIRVDKINNSDAITQTILDHLRTDELVIADMTEHNPNAFFEIGYRSALGKPMIHLKKIGETIPFDVANIRAFDYDLSDLDSVEKIKSRLIQTIENISFEIPGDDNTESFVDTESTNNILPLLYDISDKIDGLESKIKSVNSETIDSIMKATSKLSASSHAESTDDMIKRMVMEQILNNPSSADALMRLADKYGKKW